MIDGNTEFINLSVIATKVKIMSYQNKLSRPEKYILDEAIKVETEMSKLNKVEEKELLSFEKAQHNLYMIILKEKCIIYTNILNEIYNDYKRKGVIKYAE